MLCSRLSLSEYDELKPFTLGEWNRIAAMLNGSDLRPGDLLGLSLEDIQEILGDNSEAATRIIHLLGRGAALAFELERLFSLGIWIVTRADNEYPQRYRDKLKGKAPPVLFCSGDKYLPGQPGLAMVGSRNVDQHGSELAEMIGNYCAQEGLVVCSGGARGVDSFSMKAALEGRGQAVGILAHSLEKAIKSKDYRGALENGDLTLMTPYSPGAGFSVGNAMGRNKLIYALADYALVIASDFEKGGTWAGATEALKHNYAPVFAVEASFVPDGNLELIKLGALPLPAPPPFTSKDFRVWLDDQVSSIKPLPTQPSLF